jgi:glucose-1-phosphate cytidylyltransferase
MVLIDDKPIIWHIMNIYAQQGFTEFVLATGYKQELIRDWALSLDSDWDITPLDTGLETQTGGRLKKCIEFIGGKETTMATYGDGLANVNLNDLLEFHKMRGKIGTVTAVRPPARFGVIESKNGLVKNFGEKIQSDSGWINGGFFVFESQIVDYIEDEAEPLETGALPRLVKESQLSSYHHQEFWQPMDTLRERNVLSDLSDQNPPPWLRFKT